MKLQTPLGRVRGLGSAKEGVEHFFNQRLTALALIPLTMWFVMSMVGLIGADYARVKTFFATSPGNITMMILFIAVTFYHLVLGVQVVIEDYVHTESTKMASLIGIRLAGALVGVFAIVSVLKIGLGG
jgi:succinate dehydrogenase / fumarate reductase membrane anchor subunit